MNFLRQPLRTALHRTCLARHPQTVQSFRPFHVSASYGGQPRAGGSKGRRRGRNDDEDAEDNWHPDGNKAKPDSASFYTGRPVYYDQVIQLQTAIGHARKALKTLQLLPLPAFARESLPPLRPVWKAQDEMTADFQSKMTTARYRRVTTLLNELNDYLRIATAANCTDVAEGIGQIVAMFESGKKEAFLAQGKRKKVMLDNYGRAYTVGKRKTSSARVWMIPVNNQPQPSTPAPDSVEAIFGISESAPQPTPTVTMTTVLVNNIPLAEYFPVPADRERITRPFKVAGVLGAYNVFAIARGGGTTGQSGAVAHGIAKGLVAHEPQLDLVLRRGTLFAFYVTHVPQLTITYSQIVEA